MSWLTNSLNRVSAPHATPLWPPKAQEAGSPAAVAESANRDPRTAAITGSPPSICRRAPPDRRHPGPRFHRHRRMANVPENDAYQSTFAYHAGTTAAMATGHVRLPRPRSGPTLPVLRRLSRGGQLGHKRPVYRRRWRDAHLQRTGQPRNDPHRCHRQGYVVAKLRGLSGHLRAT